MTEWRINRWMGYGVIFINLIRFSLVFIMGPMPQDAYYYFYSQHPSLSYFDHPPGIMVLLWSFTTLFGNSIWVIKLANFTLTLATQWIFYHLALRMYTKGFALQILVLFNTLLLTTIVSINSTPDVPLLFFWSLSMLLAWKVVNSNRWVDWILMGISMGLAFDSKYTALALPAGFILHTLLRGKLLSLLINPRFYTAVLCFALAISPVLIWNIHHDFASFLFQSSDRAESSSFNLLNGMGSLLSQLLITGPVILIIIRALVPKAWAGLRSRSWDQQKVFAWSFAAPILLGFFLISWLTWVKINWMMPGYLGALLLLHPGMKSKWVSYQIVFMSIVHILLFIQVVFYPVIIRSDDTWEGWDQLASEVKHLKDSLPSSTFLFSADGYKTTAQLMLQLDKKVYGENIIGRPALHYDYIGDDLQSLKGLNALYINSEPRMDPSPPDQTPPHIAKYFDETRRIKTVYAWKGDRKVRQWSLYYCQSYQPPDS